MSPAIECFFGKYVTWASLSVSSQAMFTFYDSNRDLYRSLLNHTLLAPKESSPNLSGQMDEYIQFFIDIIDKEKKGGKISPDVDSYIASGGLISLYFGVLILFFSDENITPDIAMNFLKEMTTQYLKGIMTKRSKNNE